MASSMLVMCAIGASGSGKSSLCNTMSGITDEAKSIYKVGHGINACTSQTVASEQRWLGTGQRIRIIDTPGLNDPQGNDSVYIAEMVKKLKQEPYINAFLLTINSQVPRMDETARANIQILYNIFGSGFFDHVIVVFTRWSHDPKAARNRARAGETEAQKRKEINDFLRQIYNLPRDLNAVFLDNYDDAGTDEVMRKQLTNLKTYTSAMPAFSCSGARPQPGFIAGLAAEAEKQRLRNKQAEIEQKKMEAKLLEERKKSEEALRRQKEEAQRERERQEEEEKKKRRVVPPPGSFTIMQNNNSLVKFEHKGLSISANLVPKLRVEYISSSQRLWYIGESSFPEPFILLGEMKISL